MSEPVRLSAAGYQAEIYPADGGSLGRLLWRGEDLVQSCAAPERTRDPGNVGMFPMVPFGGRIAQAVFDWRGRRHVLAPHPGEPHALHGSAWMSEWTLDSSSPTQARLQLLSTGGPLAYRVHQHFSIDQDGLHVMLDVTSLCAAPMPFGLGFHPWFPRGKGSMLRFCARRFWLEGPGGLPTDPVSVPAELDFAAMAPIPASWRNNAYEGWQGGLDITYPERGLRVTVTASPNLNWLMFYANPSLDVFCLEPQSHLPDAHNRAECHGLVELAPGESMSASIAFRADALA
jgi:aldose 1-epimerase